MSTRAEDLHAALLDAVPTPETDEERARFTVDGPNTAIWALRKLAQARRKMAEATDVANAEFERVQQWLDGELKRLAHDEDFFEALLVDYHHRILADDPDAKTVRLPGGELKARKQPDAWQIDPATFVAWAEANKPDLLRVIPERVEPDKATTKKMLSVTDDGRVVDPDGQLVPGVTVTVGEDKFTVATEDGQ